MNQKWQEKKSTGNILKKERKELSPEERQLQMYQEQLEREREGSEYSAIYAKIQSGKKLNPSEEKKLSEKDPKMYMEYKADQMEQEIYEKRLRNCRTKEEAERLHGNRMNGKMSELKSIVNDPNIPKNEKLKQVQRIAGDTIRTAQIFHKFTSSVEFQKLPTEREIGRAKQVEENMKWKVAEKEGVELRTLEEEHLKEENLEKAEVEFYGNEKYPKSDTVEMEQKVLKEIFDFQEKHFGIRKNWKQVNVLI